MSRCAACGGVAYFVKETDWRKSGEIIGYKDHYECRNPDCKNDGGIVYANNDSRFVKQEGVR